MRLNRSLYNKAGTIAATAGLVLGSVSIAKADDTGAYSLPAPTGADFDTNPTDISDTIRTLVPKVLDVVLLIAGVLAVFYLIWSGVQYITSGGNADKVKVARAGIINAIIGIIIIMGAFFIIRLAVGAGTTVNGLSTSTSSSGF